MISESDARAAVALVEPEVLSLRLDPLGEGWVACTGGGVYLITGPGSAPVLEIMKARAP